LAKTLTLLLGAAFLLLVALACAYFLGQWIPNNPSRLEYPIRGVDVSGHQGRVNWKSVASSGIRFAYLKATEGGDFRDTTFVENLRGANEAGMACGAYHFFSLKSPGTTQAQNFIRAVLKESVTLPPAIDLEFVGNSSARPSPKVFQEQLGLFMKAIREEYGCEPVIYTSEDFSSVYLGGRAIKRPWVRAVLFGLNRDPGQSWIFWQFTERARVPGINGFVDMDVFNGNSAEFQLLTEKKHP
jgi:lysozyme